MLPVLMFYPCHRLPQLVISPIRDLREEVYVRGVEARAGATGATPLSSWSLRLNEWFEVNLSRAGWIFAKTSQTFVHHLHHTEKNIFQNCS